MQIDHYFKVSYRQAAKSLHCNNPLKQQCNLFGRIFQQSLILYCGDIYLHTHLIVSIVGA